MYNDCTSTFIYIYICKRARTSFCSDLHQRLQEPILLKRRVKEKMHKMRGMIASQFNVTGRAGRSRLLSSYTRNAAQNPPPPEPEDRSPLSGADRQREIQLGEFQDLESLDAGVVPTWFRRQLRTWSAARGKFRRRRQLGPSAPLNSLQRKKPSDRRNQYTVHSNAQICLVPVDLAVGIGCIRLMVTFSTQQL